MFDVTERVREAREYFDKLLDERIRQISEISDVPLECFVKINPADFLERNKNQTIDGYEYIKIGQWIRENKKDDHTFLISPMDAIEETAAQVSYKQGTEIRRTIRASKCECVPVPAELAQDFFIRNHRQSAPQIRKTAVCFGLAFKDELVAVMLYDIADGAVRGKKERLRTRKAFDSKGNENTRWSKQITKRL